MKQLIALVIALIPAAVLAQLRGNLNPMIREDSAIRVSEHVWAIPDNNAAFVPNVGIVIGERATLVIDTGLGTRNGAIVLGEARKLGAGDQFYVTATHYHPEHDLGAEAFPATAKIVRWRAQQTEADDQGESTIARFSQFAPIVAELLEGVSYRAPDILFDEDVVLDLGGVRVRAIGVGPNHTLGDTVFWVEGDRVLFTGDVVMSVFPAVSAQSGNLALWQQNLNRFESLGPETIVPAHGPNGDGEFIRRYRAYFGEVQSRVAAARARGMSLESAREELSPALADRFSELAPASGNPAGRINAAIEAAWREADQAE